MPHGAHVKNLTAALGKYPKLQSKNAEELLRDLKPDSGRYSRRCAQQWRWACELKMF
jgi:hypothetical protein